MLNIIGKSRRCQAVDFAPSEDDSGATQCPNVGILVLEHNDFGRYRTRIACAYHRSLTDEKPS